MHPNEKYPFSLALSENKLDSIHEQCLSNIKDKLWFQTKRRLQMLFSLNQHINIMYPNENYPFGLNSHEKQLDSIHEQNSSHNKDKIWFQTKWRLQMIFLWKKCINIVYPKENYPFVLGSCEKRLFYPQTKFVPF